MWLGCSLLSDERKKKREKGETSKFKRKSRLSPSNSRSIDSSEESGNEYRSIEKRHSHKKNRKRHKERSSSPESEGDSYQTLGSQDKKRNDRYERGDNISRVRSTHERDNTNYASYKSRNRSRSRSPRRGDFEQMPQRRDENRYRWYQSVIIR